MSREIKFRAKDAIFNKWVYGCYFKKKQTCGRIDHILHNGVSEIIIDVKTLGQYTGIYDKNKIAICEDDWVSAFIETPQTYSNPDDNINLIQGRVFFDAGCFLFSDDNYLDGDHIWDLEVIGNVYDNKGLLDG